MEILNMIVTYLVIYIESLALSYLVFVISSLIYKLQINNPVRVILINSLPIFVAFAAAHAIDEWFPEYSWLKSLLCIGAFTITSKISFKINWLSGFLVSIITMVCTALIELLMVIIIKVFGFIPLDILSNTKYNYLVVTILSSMYFITAFILHFIYKNIIKDRFNIKQFTKYMIPQFITIIICLIPSMALLIKNDFEYSSAFILINVVQLLVVSLVSMYNIKNVVKQKNTEQQLENTIVHNKTLMKVNEGVRGFKHDMGNIVQAILGYIALNDQEGAKKYCQNLVIGFNDINVLSILSPKVINDPAIYGVVVNKILVARENNMELSLDVSSDISKINFPKFELSRVLGILIDNAIEAGIKTTQKKLILSIHTSLDESYDEIIISNSIKNAEIPLDKIFNKDYSSKTNPSGFGLYEVAEIFNKYSQALISTTIDKEKMLFTQRIKIFK